MSKSINLINKITKGFTLFTISLLVICSSVSTQAGVIQYEDYIERVDFAPNATLELKDPQANNPTHNGAGQLLYHVERTAYVRLVYGRADRMDLDDSNFFWDMTVEYELEDLDASTPTTYTGILHIEHQSTTAILEEIGEHVGVSGHIRVRITNITTNAPSAVEDIRLELVFNIEKYDYLDHTKQPAFNISFDANTNKTLAMWQVIDGAEAYDLEWVYIDDLTTNPPINDEERFKGAARVRLSNN
jgi:hypothetical protein